MRQKVVDLLQSIVVHNLVPLHALIRFNAAVQTETAVFHNVIHPTQLISYLYEDFA